MVDLEINSNGEVILNKDVKRGEKIAYQNSYLKNINDISYAEVLIDLDKGTKLTCGYYAKGKTVIVADDNADSYLIVKQIEK